MLQDCFLIVGNADDSLCKALCLNLQGEALSYQYVKPDKLVDLSIDYDNHKGCFINGGSNISGVSFRINPETISSPLYSEADQNFCNNELSATMLAVVNDPGLFSLNRLTAEPWFEDIGWSTWRYRLSEQNVDMSKITFGKSNEKSDTWMPFNIGPTATSIDDLSSSCLSAPTTKEKIINKKILIFGECLNEQNGVDDKLKDYFINMDIGLVELGFDQHDHLLMVDVNPEIKDEETADEISKKIVKKYNDYLYSR